MGYRVKTNYDRGYVNAMDKVRVFISYNGINGGFLEPTSKRYYPYSSLAAHVIGFVNANGGAYGLEAVYDEELTGEKGMVVSARDANGNALLYQYEQYFDAENGDSLVTTLDKTVQYYLEKGLEELESRYGTGVGATGIVMDVNTGGILAMASLPTYDLNAPASTYNKDRLSACITDEERAAAADTLQNMQWRNKAINDTFQPGSTFKILTLAMALEENKVKMSDTFNCPGYVVIAGAKITCSPRAPGHGHQDLITAFANSCNPAFINIGLRLGNTTFYNYMKAFGLTGKTGVDTTGEASGYDDKLTRALYKALQATGMNVSNYGTIFVTIADHDKEQALPRVRRFYDLGFNIEATTGTAEFLRNHGIRTRTRRKLSEGSSEIIDSLRQGHVSYVINTIDINQHNTRLDGYEIRRTAVENNVTVFTALETVKVLLDVLEEITFGVSTIDAK